MADPKRIFFVEDDFDFSHLLKQQLTSLGHEVCGSASNASEAIAGIKKWNPDMVLLDMELHGSYEGIAIGHFLIHKTDIPFIYVTAHDEKHILDQARETMPDGFLLKPFSSRQLNSAIEMAHRF